MTTSSSSLQTEKRPMNKLSLKCENAIPLLVLYPVELSTFPNLNVIDVQSLGIEALSFGSDTTNFGNSNFEINVTTLDASNNHFKEVPSGILDYMPEISHIDFSYNGITRLKSDDFKRHNGISNLKFGHNNIRIIEDGAFRMLQLLEDLDLSDNPISEIGDRLFANNPKMRWLNLRNSLIKRFNFNTFSPGAKSVTVQFPSENIQQLDISCERSICHFEDFDKDEFFGDIRVLNASGNRNALKALVKLSSKLDTLDLSMTSMGTIDVKMLQRFPYLQYLKLNNANISNIEIDAFSNQWNLKTLDLSYNNLKNINSSIYFFEDLEVLNLEDINSATVEPEKTVNREITPLQEETATSTSDVVFLETATSDMNRNTTELARVTSTPPTITSIQPTQKSNISTRSEKSLDNLNSEKITKNPFDQLPMWVILMIVAFLIIIALLLCIICVMIVRLQSKTGGNVVEVELTREDTEKTEVPINYYEQVKSKVQENEYVTIAENEYVFMTPICQQRYIPMAPLRNRHNDLPQC
ncbi:toll-like receptor 3 [Contarinia nasturtii]|uniref:toll-like receptor 3 n=1 Tax=Contarinia nasturtii TaxID=265458 RepID=UPI0012D38E4A|nr:toll-like receptor 3 [Contarinia nasturtii]